MTDFELFSASSNLPLAKKVAKGLKISLGKVEIHKFSNQETRVRIAENVKGKTCAVLGSMGTPVDENWVEILFFIDALKRSGASKIIGIIPYLGYQKQDKSFRSGECISVAAVIKTLECLGMDQIITFDLHSKEILKYFKNPPLVLSAFPLFLEEIKKLIHYDISCHSRVGGNLDPRFREDDKKTRDDNSNQFVMVAPDEGSYQWMSKISQELGLPLVSVCKDRDKKTAHIPYESLKIKGDVKDKTCIIIDDNIYTGSTLILNAKLLKKNGARAVFCFVTHPILSGDAPELLQESPIDSLTVADTIYVSPEKRFPKLQMITITNMLVNSPINQYVRES